MNAKPIVALAALAAGMGVIVGAWLMGTAGPSAAVAREAANPPPAEPVLPDLFSMPAEPGPARIYFQTAGGQPMPPDARRRIRGWMDMIARLMERMDDFDLNGDGMLGDLEKSAMVVKLRSDLLAEHDLDGDGEMSKGEWETYRRAQFEASPEGQMLMRRFDADGDGVLGQAEQAAMDEHLERQRHQQDLAQMDADGDGEISEQERSDAHDRQEAFWRGQTQAAETAFDYDGDGELNIEETRDAWDAFVEYQTVDDFITRYDADADRRMGPADYDRFLGDYGRRSPSADVNSDGEINVEDINAFRELVLRSRSY